MKTTILKLLFFLFLLPICIVLLGTGCEKNEDNSEYTEIEFFKFSDFGCEGDDQWYMKDGYNNNGDYIITSQEEFEEIINVECSPQIDFSNYIILAGSKGFNHGAEFYVDKVKENNSEVIYTVTFTYLISADTPTITYYVIIEKPSAEKKIHFVKDYMN